jgi:2-methylcitrate dehydratase PrpD
MSDIYLDKFVDFMVDADYHSFPNHVTEQAKMVLIDNIGVTIYGNHHNEMFKKTANLFQQNQDRGRSRIFGLTNRFSEPMFSALLNGASAHSKQLDEAHWGAGGHPASYVVPAVLSVAETNNLSGKEVITSIILGYELAARLARAYVRKKTMHPCGTYGIVGSSAAIGKLLKQDRQTLRETIKLSANLTLATTASSALEGASVHDLYTGFTNFFGILIPQLAECGFQGESRSLEMVFGIVSGENFIPEVLVTNLGSSFEIEHNFFKQHAVCGRNISAITAFEDLLNEHPISIKTIEHIKVETYKGAVEWCANSNPDNELSAKFSIPFALAAITVFGNLYPDVFTPEHLNDPRIKEICSKVEVLENEEMTSLIPKERPAKVTVHTTDGQIYSREILKHIGERDRSYKLEHINEKFLKLTSPILGSEKSISVLEVAQAIENIEDINDFTSMLTL